MRWSQSLLAGLVCLGMLAAAAPARAQTEVDLALVLAVDISFSMDPDEQELQRNGYAEAFRSPAVQDAIRNGVVGRIAVTYVEWSDPRDQRVVVPWTVLDDAEAIMAFADRIANSPLHRAHLTSISGAIDRASQLFGGSGVQPARRVIDVSGDGPNNAGRAVTSARDEAVAKGIVINGLPLMLKTPGYLDIPNLDHYYEDCVIGGPGSFMVPVRGMGEFQEAIKAKILREVSRAPGPLIEPAQAQESRTDCMTGEEQMRDRYRK